MVFGYDVFRRLHDGSAMWVAAVPNLDEAEKDPGAVMPAPAQISQPPNAGDMKYDQ